MGILVRCFFGMQFGVLFEVLLTVRAHICRIDGGGAVWGSVQGVLLEVLVCNRLHVFATWGLC